MGQYQWRVLPFGLTNAPATFQATMNAIFRPLIGKCVLVYLDDILVYSKTPEEHAQHLQQVLQVLAENKLYAKLAKCRFNMPNTAFLGHIVGKDGIQPDPAKISIVADWPTPTNISELRSFLGLTNYFRRFVQGYSKIAAPLFQLLSTKAQWNWTATCTEAFEGLKHALTHAPVLGIPDLNKPFEVVCDASDGAIGAILLQDGKPIAYEGRRLTPTEMGKCYSTTDRELLAVIHALTMWRCYLEGTPFTLVSDHKPLEALSTKPQLTPRDVRQSQFLERFHYTWEYRQGRNNCADPVSRVRHAPVKDTPDSWLYAVTTRAQSRQPAPAVGLPPALDATQQHTAANSRTSRPVRGTALDSAPQSVAARNHTPRQKASPPGGPPMQLGDAQQLVPHGATEPAQSSNPAVRRSLRPHTNHHTPADPSAETRGQSLTRSTPTAPSPAEAPAPTTKRKRSHPQKQVTWVDPVIAAPTTDTHPEPIAWVDAIQAAYQLDPWFSDAGNLQGLTQRDGIWYKGNAMVVPKGLRTQCLEEIHDAPYSGHKGVFKTLQTARHLYWWPTLAKDVKQHVITCHACQRNKAKNQLPGGLLQSLQVPQERWHSISMDYITGLPCTDKGHDAILVVCDRLSKMARFIPCTKQVTAEDTAVLFRDHVFRNHGQPTEVISDRDSRFISKFWQELQTLLGTKHKLSTAFHPQTDGQTERCNRILEEYLRHYVNSVQDDWDNWLSLAEFAYNNSTHESTGYTPFFLNYGRHPLTPAAQATGTPPSNKVPAAATFATNITTALDNAKKMIQAARARQKAWADRRRRHVEFTVGEQVLLDTRNIKLRTPGKQKLLPKYIGPFKILSKIGEVSYKLELPSEIQVHPVFHASLLHPFRTDGRSQPPPPPISCNGEEWYIVDHILDHHDSKKFGRTYNVSFHGYGPEHNMWLPREAVTAAAEQEYFALRPSAALA